MSSFLSLLLFLFLFLYRRRHSSFYDKEDLPVPPLHRFHPLPHLYLIPRFYLTLNIFSPTTWKTASLPFQLQRTDFLNSNENS